MDFGTNPKQEDSASRQDILPLISSITGKAGEGKRILVTIDGPCASGKTTLAQMLADAMNCDVIHTDDFVVPHRQKTPERLAVPGGNCDWERLIREVVMPWKNGGEVWYQKYDCHKDRLTQPEPVRSDKLLILEGCYSNLPAIREYADVRIFLTTPEEERYERLSRRETPESLARFQSLWIPLESAYFEAYGLPDPGCIVWTMGNT